MIIVFLQWQVRAEGGDHAVNSGLLPGLPGRGLHARVLVLPRHQVIHFKRTVARDEYTLAWRLPGRGLHARVLVLPRHQVTPLLHFKRTVSRDEYTLAWRLPGRGLHARVLVLPRHQVIPLRHLKRRVSREEYFSWRSKHFSQYCLCMRWWFPRPFRSFSLPYIIIKFLFASL